MMKRCFLSLQVALRWKNMRHLQELTLSFLILICPKDGVDPATDVIK